MPRPHFAYVFERFPSFTQTFCAREVMELQRQGAKLLIFSIRDTREESLRHFPRDLIDQVINLPAPSALTQEVEQMKERRELPQSIVLTLREWAGRPDKARVYEAAWIGQKLRAAGVRHVHTHFAGLAARTAWWIRQFYGLSYSFTGHANDLFCPDQNTGLKLPRLIHDASAIITVSDFTAKWLAEQHPGSARRIFRVYNGLDLEPVRKAAAENLPKADPPLIYSVGRLIEKKGFGDLIAACALLRDRGMAFQCRIAGDGPLQEELESQIRSLQLEDRVSLAGPLSQMEVMADLGRASIFVLPCVTEKDGGRDVLPTVLMEAMAASLPCISTTLAGVPEMVIHEKTGLLVPEGQPAAVADAVGKLLTDPARAAAYGEAGLVRARALFEKEITARQLRKTLTAHGNVNGPPAAGLWSAHAQQLLGRLTRTQRLHRPGSKPVFP